MSAIKKFLQNCIVLGVIFAGPALAQAPLVVVADEWPPFSGNELPGQGLSIDLTRAVLTRAGYDVETAILPWARVMNGAQTGAYDVITSLFLDPDLEDVVSYSDPFFETTIRFVQRKGRNITFDGLDSLRPYTIAVGTEFVYEREFDAADFLDKTEVTTALQGIKMVAGGRVDLTLDGFQVVKHSIQMEDPVLLEQIEFLDPPLARQKIHMAVSSFRNDHDLIVADFNATLKEMQEDGSLALLLEKHGVD